MTIVGDMGQATTASSSSSWDALLDILAPRRTPTRVDLSVSYRTPEEVLDFAAPTLLAATPDLRAPRPVRRAGTTPIVKQVSASHFDATLVSLTRSEIDAVAPGRVAVIVTASRIDEIVATLLAGGIEAIDPRDQESKGLSADLVVVGAEGANGLEFDAVIVIEPGQIANRGSTSSSGITSRGLRTLYVAMTRPTRRLAILAVGELHRRWAESTRAKRRIGVGISTRNVGVSQAVSPNSLAKQGKIVHDRPPMLAIGVMIWLGSELMFFSGLFAALFTIRAHLATWPPVGTHLDVLQSGIFTIILIASSFTMQRAVWLIEHRRRGEARNWVITTIIMGALFVSNQAYEWTHLTTRWYTNSYGSIFFITTGLHGLHVFLGLVAMSFLLFRMRGREGDAGELATFQGVSYYWHFVDVVWIGLYSALFLLK